MWVWVKVTKNLIRLAPLDLSLHSQVLSDWLVFFPAGLACFLQPGCYDWLPDRACCCSCVDPLSSETAHIQVQVMDRHVCVCARVWMQPWGYFLYSFNFILIIYWEDLAPFVACREDDFCNNNYFLSSIILYARRQNMFEKVFDMNKHFLFDSLHFLGEIFLNHLPPPRLCFSPVSFSLSGHFVGLWPELHKNCWMNFHETWMEDASQPRIDPINFRCRSR